MSVLKVVPVQEFSNFTLVHVFNKHGDFLHTDTIPKPLPTAEHNKRIILAQQPGLDPFTDEEKTPLRIRKSHKRSLTDDQVRRIRRHRKEGLAIRKIAAMIGVANHTIEQIIKGKTYTDVN